MKSMYNKGFTLIEVIVVAIIIFITGSIFFGITTNTIRIDQSSDEMTKCVAGYEFTKSTYEYPAMQIFDENGNGIPCEQ